MHVVNYVIKKCKVPKPLMLCKASSYTWKTKVGMLAIKVSMCALFLACHGCLPSYMHQIDRDGLVVSSNSWFCFLNGVCHYTYHLDYTNQVLYHWVPTQSLLLFLLQGQQLHQVRTSPHDFI